MQVQLSTDHIFEGKIYAAGIHQIDDARIATALNKSETRPAIGVGPNKSDLIIKPTGPLPVQPVVVAESTVQLPTEEDGDKPAGDSTKKSDKPAGAKK